MSFPRRTFEQILSLEDEVARLRTENAALHQFRRAAIGFLNDQVRDRARAESLLRAGLEFLEHGFADRPTLPEIEDAEDEPSAGDAILVDTPAPAMPSNGGG